MRLDIKFTALVLALLHTATNGEVGGATGGFQLAMRFSSQSALTFQSDYWTNCALLDASDMSHSKDADGKFATFNNVVAKEIRGCLPNGCVTYTLPRPMTLHELFKYTPVSSSRNIKFTQATSSRWAAISGASGLTSGWTDTGINYADDTSTYKARVRFGALFNNEGNVHTVNDAVGFGATEASGTSVGAGWTRCCDFKVSTQGTIWVKGDKAVNPPCTTTAAAKVTTPAAKVTTPAAKVTTPAAKVKTCFSVGDPHLQQFNGVRFDSHRVGWKTLYAKGNLKIDLYQATWTSRGVGVNSAVRYSVDGGANWQETITSGAMLSDGPFTTFTSPLPDVKLTVAAADYSQYVPASVYFAHIYNVYVTTTDWAGATGQCNQGALRRRLGGSDSDGIAFPTGAAVKVSQQQAEQACGALKDQKDNCITDLRMVNEPAVVTKIVQDFVKVEDTSEKLVATGTCPNSFTFVGPGGLFMCPPGCLIKSLPGSNSKCMKCDCPTSTTTVTPATNAAPATTAAPVTTAAPFTTSAGPISDPWLSLGGGECDADAGEIYLAQAPGKLPTLEACKRACQADGQCASISYFKTNWCSFYSTECSNIKRLIRKAASYRLSSFARISTTTWPTRDLWVSVGNGACDAGGVFLHSSPGKLPNLEACKSSCRANVKCESISYFESKVCCHYSMPCKTSNLLDQKAVTLRLGGAFLKVGTNIECDMDAGEVYLRSSPGNLPSLTACKRHCQADPHCNSITYFKRGWCSLYSTKGTKFRRNKRAGSVWRVGYTS